MRSASSSALPLCTKLKDPAVSINVCLGRLFQCSKVLSSSGNSMTLSACTWVSFLSSALFESLLSFSPSLTRVSSRFLETLIFEANSH